MNKYIWSNEMDTIPFSAAHGACAQHQQRQDQDMLLAYKTWIPQASSPYSHPSVLDHHCHQPQTLEAVAPATVHDLHALTSATLAGLDEAQDSKKTQE